MLTVQSLLDELGLDLAVGASAAESPVRWVHISELEDPTPWLSGGELMLTTGIPLGSAAKQRAFVDLLADHNLAGLGVGIGFTHDKMPKALVEQALDGEHAAPIAVFGARPRRARRAARRGSPRIARSPL